MDEPKYTFINPSLTKGSLVIPAADGSENPDFEKRIAAHLALVDHGELQKEIERLQVELTDVQREIRQSTRVLKRTRAGRAAAFAWQAWATLSGMFCIAVPISYSLVVATTGNGAVVTPMSEAPDLITPRLKEGAFLRFKQGLYRHTVCPGDAMLVMVPLNGDAKPSGDPKTLIRPIVSPEAGAHPDVEFAWQLPSDMLDGRYHVEFSFASRCPTFTRSDLLAKFDIEVLP